jgi:Polymerase beta, Nucleotidyltransferase
MFSDPILTRIVPALADVPGIEAIALGGSRARGAATETSDYDIGLYFSSAQPLDTDRLLHAVRTLVEHRDAAEVTPIGGWGPWIVGGAWLKVDGRKVDLLYRNLDDVGRVIAPAAGVRSRWTTSLAIPTASARRSGWAKSHCAGPSPIPGARLSR